MANPYTKLSKIQFLPVRPVDKWTLEILELRGFFFYLSPTYNDMNIIPDKTKKIQQENFSS